MLILQVFKNRGRCVSRALQACGMALVVSGILFAAGCRNAPTTTVAAKQQEPMFPTLKLNRDLIRPFKPTNDRNWAPELAVLSTAEIHGNKATIHNIRDCHWRTLEDFDLAHCDRTYDLDKLTSVDFIVAPFNEAPSLAHTMLSFGFEDKDYLAVSVEIRKEKGDKYNPIRGVMQQYEIMYVLASERDVVQRRVNCDLSDVFIYRSTATPKQARELFVDVMRRVNKLAKEPEFYDTLTNNCTTNIRNHINHLKPNEVPYDYRVLLPGYSDRLAYDLGLIRQHGSYEETRLRARVNYQAYLYRDDPAFSQKIRR
jgi:hypothetical protein